MAQSLLTIGPVHTMVQNQIYSMPARATRGYTNAAGLEGNTVNSAVGMAAITLTAGEFATSAPFIRCTSSSPNIRLQA